MNITLESAEAMISVAQEYAVQQGVSVSCSIVDDRGFEIATARMDGASAFTAGIARTKAQTAVALRRDTADLSELSAKYPELIPLMEDQLPHRVTTLPGGLALWVADRLVGGIGVSGADPAVDVSCAASARDWLSRRDPN